MVYLIYCKLKSNNIRKAFFRKKGTGEAKNDKNGTFVIVLFYFISFHTEVITLLRQTRNYELVNFM